MSIPFQAIGHLQQLVFFAYQSGKMVTGRGWYRSKPAPKSDLPDTPATYFRYRAYERGAVMPERYSKNQAARQIWLLYFNRILLERGVITQREHNRMKVKIQAQTAKQKENRT